MIFFSHAFLRSLLVYLFVKSCILNFKNQKVRKASPSFSNQTLASLMEKRKTVTFLAFGTRGDILPLLRVANHLGQTDHRIRAVLVTHASFVAEYSQSNPHVAFVPVQSTSSGEPTLGEEGRDNEEEEEEEERSSMWPQRAHEREVCVKSCQGSRLIVGNLFCLEAFSIAELYRVPCLFISPFFQTERIPTELAVLLEEEYPDLVKALRRPGGGWEETEHWMWRMFLDDIGDWRSELGLPPVPFLGSLERGELTAPCQLLYTLAHSTDRPRDQTHPPETCRFVGFIVANESSSNALPSDIVQFTSRALGEGKRLVGIGFGSMENLGLADHRTLLPAILDALRQSNMRGIWATTSSSIHTAWKELDEDSKSLLHVHCGLLGHAQLFSQCSVVLHHGGAGTFSAALLAQRPQIILPFIFDQGHRAERVSEQSLGVGLSLDHKGSGSASLAKTLQDAFSACLSSEGIQSQVASKGQELRVSSSQAMMTISNEILQLLDF